MITYGGGPRKSRSGGALGLDYDDGSDSEGSNGAQSPRIPIGPEKGDISARSGQPEEREEDLGDVAIRMRAKRIREEEEEEGFAGMLVGKGVSGIMRTPKKEKGKDEEKENGGIGGRRDGTPMMRDKKLRLKLRSIASRFSGGD